MSISLKTGELRSARLINNIDSQGLDSLCLNKQEYVFLRQSSMSLFSQITDSNQEQFSN